MDSEVTRLLEGAAARVSGVMNINSSSEENNTRIWIEFRPEIDTDQAASDVREAISRIERDLPDALEQLSVYKADERAGEIMRIAVRSSVHTDEELNRFVEQDIVPRIVSLPGVADASLLGSRQRVLRIILDPSAPHQLRTHRGRRSHGIAGRAVRCPGGQFPRWRSAVVGPC